MELIKPSDLPKFLQYLPRVKQDVENWQLVNIHLLGDLEPSFSAERIAETLHANFADQDGRIYQCNTRDLIAVLWWPADKDTLALSRKLEHTLPEGRCELLIHSPDEDGLKQLELRLHAQSLSSTELEFVPISDAPRVLIADDDLYIRTLVKKGLDPSFSVIEVSDGNGVLASYERHRPHLVFLDIHLPGRTGQEILNDLIQSDKHAHVVMLSADSSAENVQQAIRHGAKSFLTKPFTKAKLTEVVNQCPALHQAASKQ